MCQLLFAVWTAEADNEKQLLTKSFQINLQIWGTFRRGQWKGKWDDYCGCLSRWEWEVGETVSWHSGQKMSPLSWPFTCNHFLLTCSNTSSILYNVFDVFSLVECCERLSLMDLSSTDSTSLWSLVTLHMLDIDEKSHEGSGSLGQAQFCMLRCSSNRQIN